MAGVSFEEFSAPPGSELALEPLFGGNILESEGGARGGAPRGGEGLREKGEGEGESPERRRRRLKLQALGRRCREIRQVNARALQRLRQVQRVTRRLQLERRFLMQVLDSHGDRYRQGQLTVLLQSPQDEAGPAGGVPAAPTPGNAENEPPERGGPAPPPAPPPEPPPEPPGAKRRRRDPRGGRRGGGPQNGPGATGQPKVGEGSALGPSPTWGPPSPPEKAPRGPKFSDFD
ncbi:TCF3 fusion partner [Chamaea fasciata]|uniref:TCF3 fusion partner n=1 Tax=Chamaea fasciata TaxID=190680 RepID=UPI003369CD4B